MLTSDSELGCGGSSSDGGAAPRRGMEIDAGGRWAKSEETAGHRGDGEIDRLLSCTGAPPQPARSRGFSSFFSFFFLRNQRSRESGTRERIDEYGLRD